MPGEGTAVATISLHSGQKAQEALNWAQARGPGFWDPWSYGPQAENEAEPLGRGLMMDERPEEGRAGFRLMQKRNLTGSGKHRTVCLLADNAS